MRPIFSIIEKYQKYATGEIKLTEREKRIFNEVLLEPLSQEKENEQEINDMIEERKCPVCTKILVEMVYIAVCRKCNYVTGTGAHRRK